MKVITAKNWPLVAAPDGRRYSKYPDGELPAQPVELPAKIQNFITTSIAPAAVSFSWNTDPLATSYTLSRGLGTADGVIDGQGMVDVGTVSHPTNTITDNGPGGGFVEGQWYYWRVRGVNASGDGAGADRLFALPFTSTGGVENPDLVPSSVIWHQNFESLSGDFLAGSWYGDNAQTASGNSWFRAMGNASCPRRVVTAEKYNGTQCLEAIVPALTSPSTSQFRAELALLWPLMNQTFVEGTEFWWGYAMKLAPNWPWPGGSASGESNLYSSVHGQEVNQEWLYHETTSSNTTNPSWCIRLDAGGAGEWSYFGRADRANGVTISRAGESFQNDRGKWIRVVRHTKLSQNGTGFWRIWFDDALVVEVTGVTTWPPVDNKFGYFQLGVYASAYKYATVAHERKMWIDEVRICNGTGNYDTADPGSYI